MLEPELHFRTEKVGRSLVLSLSGEVTSSSEKAVQTAHDELNDLGLEVIIIDFSQVNYINSAGMAVLITLLTKMRHQGQQLLFTRLSDYFLKIFTTIGLTRYSRYFPTLEEAIAQIQPKETKGSE
jgi:anti-sigma B factor antagonist